MDRGEAAPPRLRCVPSATSRPTPGRTPPVRLSRGGSFATTPALAFALAVPRRTRRLGRALLAALIALQADVARGRPVPGASDNASGVAATLALVERWSREPPPGCEVVALFPGCEEAGMGGMAAWLREEGAALDPSRTLVLGLDTLGAGDPVLAGTEGPLLPVRCREQDLAWASSPAADDLAALDARGPLHRVPPADRHPGADRLGLGRPLPGDRRRHRRRLGAR
jgi:hypothetical protein